MHANRHIILFCISLILLSACSTFWRTIRYNGPSPQDYRIFPRRYVARQPQVRPLYESADYQLPPAAQWAYGKFYEEGMDTEAFFRNTNTTAFLILRQDTLLYEYYEPGRDRASVFSTFSLSKPFVSTLVGIAIGEGYIDSLDQHVADYLPPFRGDTLLEQVTIRHLLQMSSGLKDNEGFMPWSNAVRLYYGKDVARVTRKVRAKEAPGETWHYSNLNTQLLGMILEQATGRSLSQYMSEKIWQPAGAESDAFWSLDAEDGTEKAFCCLQGRARDFARFGLLWLEAKQGLHADVIPPDWVRTATALDTTAASGQRYQMHWYTSAHQEDFYGEGLLGQFIYVSPKSRTIIVRFGRGLKYRTPWYGIFRNLAGLSDKPQAVELSTAQLERYEGRYVFGLSNFGDSLMYGKEVEIRAHKKGLKVKNNWSRPYIMTPSSDSTFFNLQAGRRFTFIDASIGPEPKGRAPEMEADSIPVRFECLSDRDSTHYLIRWERLGNEWILREKEE